MNSLFDLEVLIDLQGRTPQQGIHLFSQMSTFISIYELPTYYNNELLCPHSNSGVSSRPAIHGVVSIGLS
jgi:hypothetical protein